MYSTGNPERDKLLLRAIQTAKACHDPLTVESLSNGHLPSNPPFELDQDELDGMISNLPPEPMPQARGPLVIDSLPDGRKLPPPDLSSKSLNNFDTLHANETAQPHEDAAKAAPNPDLPPGQYVLTRPDAAAKLAEAEARRALDVANRRLMAARDARAITSGVLRARRADLEAAKIQYGLLADNIANANDSILSREARQQREIRAHLAGEQARRAELAGRGPRMHTWNHGAVDPITGRTGFKGRSRGAFSRQEATHHGFRNVDPRRGAVPKVPSEQ